MGLFSKVKSAVSKVGRTVSRVGSSVSSAVSRGASSISSAVGSVSAGVRNFADTVLDGMDSFNDWENIATGALNGLAGGGLIGSIAGIGSSFAGNVLNERAEDRAEKEEQKAIAEANLIQRQIEEKTNAYNKAAAEYNKATKKLESAVVNSVRSSSAVGVGSVNDSWKVIYRQFTEKLKSSILLDNGLSSVSSVVNT